MEIYTEIKRDTYQDSMKLMQLQTSISEIPGVIDCGAMMATPQNKSQLKAAGLLTDVAERCGLNDLCIVVKAESKEEILAATAKIEEYFHPKMFVGQYAGETPFLPKSIDSALRVSPKANLAIISVPGQYATMEAIKALEKGLHVFLFSNNVPLEEEVELKELAEKNGLLVMGPDCGTAIISGIPLGLANAVRRGRIGIVAASGSGLMEVSCLIHRMGEGVSQAIGTGGRDLSKEVGGKTFTTALRALISDDETELIILMSKQCNEKVVNRMIEHAVESKKPVVTYFPNSIFSIPENATHIYRAMSLDHIAASGVALVQGDKPPKPLTKEVVEREMSKVIHSESSKFSADQKYLRALLTGGTFSDQAKEMLRGFFENLYAFPSHGETLSLENPLKSEGHCIIDMGDDFFTQGKLHPMMDPALRIKRIWEEIKSRNIRVLLLDVALGFGAHSDPCGGLSQIIYDAKKFYEQENGNLSVVVHLCGTEEDPQNYKVQKKKLESSGAVVIESSTRAALLAGLIASQEKENRIC